MRNKGNTEIKVLTFYDGETEAVDAFADVIRYKIRQRIRDKKNIRITTGTGGNDSEGTYNEGKYLTLRNRRPDCAGDGL